MGTSAKRGLFERIKVPGGSSWLPLFPAFQAIEGLVQARVGEALGVGTWDDHRAAGVLHGLVQQVHSAQAHGQLVLVIHVGGVHQH